MPDFKPGSRIDKLLAKPDRGAWRSIEDVSRTAGDPLSDVPARVIHLENFQFKGTPKAVEVDPVVAECVADLPLEYYASFAVPLLWPEHYSRQGKAGLRRRQFCAVPGDDRQRRLEARVQTLEAELASIRRGATASESVAAEPAVPGRAAIRRVKGMTRAVFGGDVQAVFCDADDADESHWIVSATLPADVDQSVAAQKVSDWHDRLIDIAPEVGGGAVRLDLRYQ